MAKIGFWEGFGDDTSFVDIVCEDDGSLAMKVLDEYGIPHFDSSAVGGSVSNLDIKYMDAMQVLKLSLLEEVARSNIEFLEPAILHSEGSLGTNSTGRNEEGNVSFEKVGTYEGLSNYDIYYTIQTTTYIERCSGVMVYGGKPPVKRRDEYDNPPAEWMPIWGDSDNVEIYDFENMVLNCSQPSFTKFATIVYPDPHVQKSEYNNNINNLYEISNKNPWDTIMGYVPRITFTDTADALVQSNTNIKSSRQSTINVQIGGLGDNPTLGELLRRPRGPSETAKPECWSLPNDDEDVVDYRKGIKVDIPEKFRYEVQNDKDEESSIIDTLIDIDEVLVIGLEVSGFKGMPKTDADAVSSEELTKATTYREVYIDNASTVAKRLQKGIHFVVAYENDPLEDGYDSNQATVPYIVFANNMRDGDECLKDNGIYKAETTFDINQQCLYAKNETGEIKPIEELQDIEGTILPINNKEAIWVKQVYAIVKLDTPCITIYSPQGRAYDIAIGLNYDVKPLVLIDEPPPIGYASASFTNGKVIDQTQKVDHDPTTIQELHDTDYEIAVDEMALEGNGLVVTLSFLNDAREDDGDLMTEEYVKTLAARIYEYMNADGTNTTYVCGPDAEPHIGGYGLAGGIINSVTYSYADSSAYTISVEEGSILSGPLSQVSGGTTTKANEQVSATGQVIEDMGNDMHYKVRLDGIGDVTGFKTFAEIIRVGDRVSCTIHNNPVET